VTSEIVASQALSAIAGSAPQVTAGGDTMTVETGDAVAAMGSHIHGIVENTATSGVGTVSHHAVAVTIDILKL
jgi:hypothetical protein